MRYRSLCVSGLVLMALAACKGNDAGMTPDLARDIASARSNDALALAPRSGVQTVVSAEELSPQGRMRVAPSARSTRAAAHRTPHRDRVTRAPSAEVASTAAAPAVSVSPSSSSSAEPSVTVTAPSPRPQPVSVSYPSNDPGPARGDGGGGGGWGSVIGAIGGAILRGGVVGGGDGDHCDPRSHGGGRILVNNRGPILRGNFLQ